MEISTGDPVNATGPPPTTTAPPNGKPAAVSVVKSITAIAQRLNGQSLQKSEISEAGKDESNGKVNEGSIDGGSAVISTVENVTGNQATVATLVEKETSNPVMVSAGESEQYDRTEQVVVESQSVVTVSEQDLQSEHVTTVESETRNEPVPQVSQTRTEPVPPPPVSETRTEPVPPVSETRTEPVPPVSETRTEPVPPVSETRTEQVPQVSNEGSSDSNDGKIATQVVSATPSNDDVSNNPVPIETNVNQNSEGTSENTPPVETMVSTNDASKQQTISTIQDTPLSEQGITVDNEGEPEVTQIINKPLSAMGASSSSRKNRRKASRPMQINRENTDIEVESSSQESNSARNDVNIESMIHAASDITDFCDIANRFLGGDDSQDDVSPSERDSPSTHEDEPHQVPVHQLAQAAIARQQNIPISTTPSTTNLPILRQSLLPARHRTSSPTTQQQRASPQQIQPTALRSVPKLIYKPAQQIIRHVPQQQQQVFQQQQQQFFVPQVQGVQGQMIQNNMIQGGMIQQQIQQQPSMIVQQPQQQSAIIQQGAIMQPTMVAQSQPTMMAQSQPGVITQQFVQQAAPQQVVTNNIITQPAQQQQIVQQPQQQAAPMMIPKPAQQPGTPTQSGRPGQTILVLQRGDTLKLDASGNLVVVGKGDPPAGATPAPAPAPKPANVMQHTAVQNIVQMQNQVATNVQPAVVSTVRAPIANIPTQDQQQFVVQQPQQPQQTKLLQQLTAQPQIAQVNQFSPVNQLTLQSQMMAKGPSQSQAGNANVFFTPSTQAPFQIVASSNAGKVIPKTPPALISYAGSNLAKPVVEKIVTKTPASSKIKLIASAVASSKNPIQVIDDSHLVKNSSGDVTLLQCDKCKRLFVSKESLLKHLETEMHMETSQETKNETKKYQCSACNETFVYQSSLTLHESKLCSKQPWTTAGQSSPFSFVCGLCKLRFKFKQELELHMEQQHNGQEAPVVKTPFSISTWGTMRSDKPNPKENPPLITRIKMEPGMLPMVQTTTVTTTPPKKLGRPRKLPPGTPMNKAGTALAPVGVITSPRGRGRPPKPKSPGSSAKKRNPRPRPVTKSSSTYGPPPDGYDEDEDDNGENAYVVKDEKATTRYLCTTHGKYDTSDPRPHRCTLCPKGFLSQHCLLEHIKTHIKPFWCSKCGWKSSRKDNVMRHIELHHQGPKYKQKRKSPATGKYDPTSKKFKAMDGIVEGGSDLIDYQGEIGAEDEEMDTEDRNEEEDGGESDGDHEVDEQKTEEAELTNLEKENSDKNSEQTENKLNKEGPDEPDKIRQPSPDEGAITSGDGKDDVPSSEESLVTSTTNHFLGFSSQTGSKPHTLPESSAITQPSNNTRACLGGEITNNNGLTTNNSSCNDNVNQVQLTEDEQKTNHDNSTIKEVEVTDTEMTATEAIDGDNLKQISSGGVAASEGSKTDSDASKKNQEGTPQVCTPEVKTVESAEINSEEKIESDQVVEMTEVETVDKKIGSGQQSDVNVENADKMDSSNASVEITMSNDLQTDEEVVSMDTTQEIHKQTAFEDGRPRSPPYFNHLDAGNIEECIVSLVDEMISSLEESEEEDNSDDDVYEEMDVQSLSSGDDADEDEVMSGCEMFDEASNQGRVQEAEASRDKIADNSSNVQESSNFQEDVGNGADQNNQMVAQSEMEHIDGTMDVVCDEVSTSTTGMNSRSLEMDRSDEPEIDNTPVVFQIAPDDQDDDSQGEISEPAAAGIESQTPNISPGKTLEPAKLIGILQKTHGDNETKPESEEVMIIDNAGEKPISDVIDIESDDENDQMVNKSVENLPNMSTDLPAPPPLITTASSSILGRKTLTKRSSGVLDKVLQRLEPKVEAKDSEMKSTEEMSLLQLEQNATQVIENAEKALMEQGISSVQPEQQSNETWPRASISIPDTSASQDVNAKQQEEQLPVIASVTSLRPTQEKPVPSSIGHSIANMMGEPQMMRPAGHQMIPGQGLPYPMPPPHRFDPRYMRQPDGALTIDWRNRGNANDPRVLRPPVTMQSMMPPGMQVMYNTDPRFITPEQIDMMRQQGLDPSRPLHLQQQQQHPAFVRAQNQHMSSPYMNQQPRLPQQFAGMPGTMPVVSEHQSVPSSPTIVQGGVQYSPGTIPGTIPGREKTPPTPTTMNAMDVVPGARMFNDDGVIHVQSNGTSIIVPQQGNNKMFFNPNEIPPNIPPNIQVGNNSSASQLKKMLSTGVPDTNVNYSSVTAATAGAGPANSSFQPAMQINGEIPKDQLPAFSPTTPISTEQNVPMQHRRHSSGSSKRRREKPSPENRRKSTTTSSIQSTDPDFDITERPYICHICGKGFKRRNNLTDHVRIHSRPYKCGECNFGTTRWQYLAEHMRKAHGFEADDKEFEKLFKDSGKKLKPTDYIPESSLMPITARAPSTGSGSDDVPTQLGASSWTNSGEFNRKETLTTNDTDLVDFYGQVEQTFVSPSIPKQIKKTNMRRAATAAEDLINKVTKEDQEGEQVLIKPMVLPKSVQKAKVASTDSEWQAFIKETGSETSERTDLTETEESRSVTSSQPILDHDESSIAPSSVDEDLVTIKQEQMSEYEAMEMEETDASYADESDNKENIDAGNEHALLDDGVAMSCETEENEGHDGEVATAGVGLDLNSVENTGMEEAYDDGSEADSFNNNEQEREIEFSKSGRPRRRSLKIDEQDIRDIYDDDYKPYSYGAKKKKGIVMKINLKEMSVRGRGRGRPKGSLGRGRGGGGRGGGGGGGVGVGGGGGRGRGMSNKGRGIRREENRISLPPEGDVPIKTNEQGGIDLQCYYIEVGDPQRPFMCQVNDCRKTFKSKQHMREHLFTHLRPYKCDICGMGFARTDYLAMHMKDDHNVKATKEQLFEKRKLANARAMVCRSRPSKDHKRQELYEILNSPPGVDS